MNDITPFNLKSYLHSLTPAEPRAPACSARSQLWGSRRTTRVVEGRNRAAEREAAHEERNVVLLLSSDHLEAVVDGLREAGLLEVGSRVLAESLGVEVTLQVLEGECVVEDLDVGRASGSRGALGDHLVLRAVQRGRRERGRAEGEHGGRGDGGETHRDEVKGVKKSVGKLKTGKLG